MALTPMTPEQMDQMRAKAQETRKAQSAALARVGAGQVTLPDVLADQDSPLWHAKVRTVLLKLPGVGAVTADKALADAGVHESRRKTVRVRGLGDRQRAALAARFPAAA